MIRFSSQENTYPIARTDDEGNLSTPKYVSLPLEQITVRDQPDMQSTCFEAKLIVKDTQLPDEIEYTLFVMNDHGEHEQTLRLRVSTPLSLPILIAIVIIIFAVLIAFGMLVIVVIRRRRKESEHESSDDLKEEIDGKPVRFHQVQCTSAKQHCN